MTDRHKPAKDSVRDRADFGGTDAILTGRSGDDPNDAAAESQSQSQSLGERLLRMNEVRQLVPPSQTSVTSSSVACLLPGSLNSITTPHLCLNCASQSRPESAAARDIKYSLQSSPRSLAQAHQITETPLTASTDDNLLCRHQEDSDDGLHGWPDPIAVECIQDDVCRLCLADPDLEAVIADCVDRYLLEARFK